MIRRPPRSTLSSSSAASDVYKRQILSIPKTTTPLEPADYRPISITSVISRVLERIVVTDYIYPSLLFPPPGLNFSDQFAFQPSASTTAAIINLLHVITNLLRSNPYVIVY